MGYALEVVSRRAISSAELKKNSSKGMQPRIS